MFELTDAALLRLGQAFVNVMRFKISQKIYPYGHPVDGVGNKIASGQLYNSLQADVISGTNGQPSQLQITYIDYFKYVNSGRRPLAKKVPIQAILNWIKIKGVAVRNTDKTSRRLRKRNKKTGRFGTDLSLAFAIQQNIFKYGIRPAKIYDLALDDVENIFNNVPDNLPPDVRQSLEELYQAVEGDVNTFIERTVDREIQNLQQL
jgi:hypothetical protein